MAKVHSARNKTEFQIILNALERNRGIQARLIGEITALTALRIGDVLAITTKQIDKAFKRRVLKIVESKTKKIKMIPLTEKMVEILSKLRQSYPYAKYLFESRYGGRRKPISRNRVWEWMTETEIDIIEYRAQLGIISDVNFGSHTLRKSGSRLRIQAGCQMEDIQQLLNHSKIETTNIYLDNDSEDLARTYRKGDDALF